MLVVGGNKEQTAYFVGLLLRSVRKSASAAMINKQCFYCWSIGRTKPNLPYLFIYQDRATAGVHQCIDWIEKNVY